jgi:hypothetical protein
MASVAALDAGRAVADHPVELLLELGHHPGDALLGERVLVARLRGRQDRQRVEPLVADQRLGELGVALHDVDEVVDDAALGPHHEVEVAQADVEIDDDDVLPPLRERRPERCRRRGLADPALARRHHHHLRHCASPSPIVSRGIPS